MIFSSLFRTVSMLFGAIIVLLAITSAAVPQTVTVDSTFAPVLQNFSASAVVSALQPDGKILVGGRFTVASGRSRSGIARFNADGTIDPTFDAGNVGVAENIPGGTVSGGTIYTIKIQPDGKILIGGTYQRDNETFSHVIERLNADGSVDQTFQAAIQDIFASIADIEMQSDGKIVIGGSFQITAINPANNQPVTFRNLARLNPNGSFDFGFVANADDNSNEIVIQADGKIVAGNRSTTSAPDRLVRYNTNGSLDTVLTNFDDWVTGLELLPDGKFVVAGYFKFVNDVFQKFIVRLNADGTRDASFASSVQFINSLSFADVAVQTDGKYLVCGEFSTIDSATRWRVARYNADGSLDDSFNTATPIAGVVGDVLALPDGKVFIGGVFPLDGDNTFYYNIGRLNQDGSIDRNFNRANVTNEGEGYSILQQPDGKVLVGGGIYYANDLKRRGIARYNADGTIDTGFVPTLAIGYLEDIALQADGKILLTSGDSPSTMYRLNADGSQDTSFNPPFIAFSATIQRRTRITQILVQPDGKILVSGQLITGSSTSPNLSGLVRLNQNGSLDTTFQIVRALGGTRDVHDIALQPDGKIVIGGDFSYINNNTAYHNLARVNADGTTDTTFTSPSFSITSPIVYEIELQADGKIVYAGNFNLVSRVNPNGSPDASFSVPVNQEIRALKTQPGGKILVGGYFTSIANAPRNRIARLNADGSIDAGFNIPNGANNLVYDFSLQTDGKILVAGAFTKLGNQERIGAARIIDSTSARRASFDFDGDGRSDISVFRPSNGGWYLMNSTNGFIGITFGLSSDQIAPADFDGDGKTDVAVFRDGVWYWLNSSNGSFTAFQFGTAGDVPVPADYTGDGRAELAVYRAGIWYTWNLADSRFGAVQFGISTDKTVPADYDGDGRTDFAVYRDGVWYLLRSTAGFTVLQFGIASDKPTVGDYDGDGKADQAVYRSGTWYILGSSQGFYGAQFGQAGDIPVAADYDGDGKIDFAVYRDGVWYLLRSQQNFGTMQFGLANDKPIPAAFVP